MITIICCFALFIAGNLAAIGVMLLMRRDLKRIEPLIEEYEQARERRKEKDRPLKEWCDLDALDIYEYHNNTP